MKSTRNNTVLKGIAILAAALAIKKLARLKRKSRVKLSDFAFPQASQPLKYTSNAAI